MPLLSGRRTIISLSYEFHRLQDRHLRFWQWYNDIWPSKKRHQPTVHFIDHHQAHAAGSYYVSPWDSAALLSVDGWGEWSTTWLGQAEGNSLTNISESLFPHSLGVFYSAATEFCGFKVNYDEGKTMGLAPTGDPDRFFGLVDSFVDVDDDGVVGIDLDWFDFPDFHGRLCGKRLIDALGAMRSEGGEIEQHHRDAAAAFQAVLEKNVLKLACILSEKTKQQHLVFAGGVALNSVANGRILREGIFDDIFVMPGAGDNGTAIGAAAYVHSEILKAPSRIVHNSPFLGREYSNREIEAVLSSAKAEYRKVDDVATETARLLSDGNIVGWFQGRMEFGPRALGGRSILANPTDPDMKRKINAEVKHREPFRPFAPSVIVERTKDYFDIDVAVPFMLKVGRVHDHMQKAIPAVVHVDGTARLQTVEERIAPTYHRLISEFGRLSGHPVVLNTSFNVMGEPIVDTPQDALRCFYATGLDALAIGDFILEKAHVRQIQTHRHDGPSFFDPKPLDRQHDDEPRHVDVGL